MSRYNKKSHLLSQHQSAATHTPMVVLPEPSAGTRIYLPGVGILSSAITPAADLGLAAWSISWPLIGKLMGGLGRAGLGIFPPDTRSWVAYSFLASEDTEEVEDAEEVDNVEEVDTPSGVELTTFAKVTPSGVENREVVEGATPSGVETAMDGVTVTPSGVETTTAQLPVPSGAPVRSRKPGGALLGPICALQTTGLAGGVTVTFAGGAGAR